MNRQPHFEGGVARAVGRRDRQPLSLIANSLYLEDEIGHVLRFWREFMPGEDAANVAWVRELFQTLRPHMRPGVYVNFMSGDEDDRVREAYHAQWQRLLAVKDRYDPQNFFRLNQDIRSQRAASADPR